MRNRILFLTRNTIPYVKELQPLTGSVSGCILMQQLDYWFERHPTGFWKFLEPSTHQKYRAGDSWVEELGMSHDEFRTAFDRIGIRYKSKSLFDQAADKFQGKFYCSYLDRRDNLTFYFRNHKLVDEALDALIFKDKQQRAVNEESRFTVNRESRFTVNGEPKDQEINKVDLQEIDFPHFNTDTTFTKTTQIPQLQDQAEANDGSGSRGDEIELIFPRQLKAEEKQSIYGLIKNLQLEKQQGLLDELQGALNCPGLIKRSVRSYMDGLVKKENEGNFNLDLGLAVLSKRKMQENNVSFKIKKEMTIDLAASAKGAGMFRSGLAQKKLNSSS